MSTVIIACETIKDELLLAIRETNTAYQVYYVESGLHNKPDILRLRIQEEIDKVETARTILMAFGFCGSSLLGVKSKTARMVIPKVDDCIPLLLGSAQRRKKISDEMGTYFLTKGWLKYETNIIGEYERCTKKYGKERALRIMKLMLGNYKRFMVIDTGAYNLESILPRTKAFTGELNMIHEIVSASPRLFHKLLLGSWDDEFIVLEPGAEITLNDICGVGNGARGQLDIAGF